MTFEQTFQKRFSQRPCSDFCFVYIGVLRPIDLSSFRAQSIYLMVFNNVLVVHEKIWCASGEMDTLSNNVSASKPMTPGYVI